MDKNPSFIGNGDAFGIYREAVAASSIKYISTIIVLHIRPAVHIVGKLPTVETKSQRSSSMFTLNWPTNVSVYRAPER